MSAKILIGSPVSPEILKRLNQQHEVHCISSMQNQYEEVLEKIADYDALLCMGHKADKVLMDKGSRLKVISNYGVGYDNVDVAYAKEKGIAVTNLPMSTSAPTANMAIGLMLSLMLKITLHDRKLRKGDFTDWKNRQHLGNSPGRKTLGIVGMGRIGKEVAKRALAMDMKVAYYKRTRWDSDTEKKYQAQYLSLEELLKESDIITLHTPLNASTHHLIGKEELALMKKSAFLINTARGSVVDNEALIEALNKKGIAGAGLDVFPNEPEVPAAYFDMPHVVLTPHAGTGTVESRQDMFEEAFSNAVAILAGEELEARVV